VIFIKKLHILLAESSIELIPKHLLKNPRILKVSRKLRRPPTKMLLEVNYHRDVIKTLPHHEKRGRPDILHTTLLFLLDSPLNKYNLLNIYIHTINDEIFWVNPKVRIPKTYLRFYGLMVQLLKKGIIYTPNTHEVLFERKQISISNLVKSFKKAFLLSEKGHSVSPGELAKRLVKLDNPLVIIGGFPHGDVSDIFYSFPIGVI